MEDFRTYSKRATDSMDKLQEEITRMDNMPPPARKKVVAECEQELKRTRADLDSCNINVLEMENEGEKSTAKLLLNQLNDRFNNLKSEIALKKLGPSSIIQGEGPAEREDLAQMEVADVIKRGETNYLAAEQGLQRAFKTTVVTKEVANKIEMELHEQGQQIDRIEDEARGIKGHLKVANKLLNQIYRRYLTDRCILCLIIIIILVIIFLIIYGAVSDSGLSTSEDQV